MKQFVPKLPKVVSNIEGQILSLKHRKVTMCIQKIVSHIQEKEKKVCPEGYQAQQVDL